MEIKQEEREALADLMRHMGYPVMMRLLRSKSNALTAKLVADNLDHYPLGVLQGQIRGVNSIETMMENNKRILEKTL